jgi:imidazolonepropionase-like amidohydrolase
VSPRIFATGAIVTYPGSHGSNEFGTQVDSWPEAIPALDAHIARRPDLLKLTFEERGWGARPMIPILPVDLMQRIIHYYNDRGIRTTVHTSSEYRARQAIFAGIDTLAHPIIQGPVTDDFARLMGAKKIPMVTTIAIGENYSRLAEHPEYLDEPLYQATLTAEEIEILKTEKRKEYQERKWTWWMKIMTTIAQENLRKINEAGGILVAGTDQTTGPALHRELELLADAGIPPSDIIRIATLNGAIFLGKERELGSIEEGKIADLVLLAADPTTDINNTKQIVQVIKGGQLIDRSKLKLPINE